MHKIEQLLSQLNKVKSKGGDHWEACCPAHDDKSPSLSITAKDNKILLHCFAGCSPLEVLHAVNLEMSDLFEDDKPYIFSDTSRQEKSYARDQIHSIDRAIMRYEITKSWINDGKKLTPEEAFKANMAKKYLQDRGYL